MNVNLLIDSIVRQTMLLIAQLATTAGARAPLAHIANQVFLDLVTELKAQGLGHKVIADMFGLALRTYHSKIQRVSESATDRGRSLWEAVLSFIRDKGIATRAEILKRFCRDEEISVRGVLNDLVESGILFKTGRGDRTSYRETTAEEIERGAAIDPVDHAATVLWVMIHQQGEVSKEALSKTVVMPQAVFDAALDQLVKSGRVSRIEQGEALVFQCDQCVIPYGDSVGWEAAIFDHYQAVSTAIANKVRRGASRAVPDEAIGGSTFHYDLYRGHPLEKRVLGLLKSVREQASTLRQEVKAHNQQQKLPEKENYRVVFYAGQNLLMDELDETKGDAK